ncbi:MAG: hypothetical protein N3D10_00825 [Candidatus Micrarchaeota archaeon]|nr:hypothetical protein [Candidatus Micrarchaeota archaeon]
MYKILGNKKLQNSTEKERLKKELLKFHKLENTLNKKFNSFNSNLREYKFTHSTFRKTLLLQDMGEKLSMKLKNNGDLNFSLEKERKQILKIEKLLSKIFYLSVISTAALSIFGASKLSVITAAAAAGLSLATIYWTINKKSELKKQELLLNQTAKKILDYYG